MSELISFIGQHQVMIGAVGAIVVSAAVRALPEPNGNKFYRWFYTFTHLLLANFDKTGKTGKP